MTSVREVERDEAGTPAAPAGTSSSSTSSARTSSAGTSSGSTPGPTGQLSARRTRTRQRVLAAALAVFGERGVIGASVEEICEAAGFTRGAFYSNFADKDALVLALIEQGVAEEYASAEEAVAELKAQDPGLLPAQAVALVLGRLNHGGPSDRTSLLAQQELLLYAARVPGLREPYETFVEACRAQIHALVVDALAYAQLDFTMPVEVALDLLMAAHDHMHQRALFTGHLDPTAMHALIMNLTRPRDPASLRPGQKVL